MISGSVEDEHVTDSNSHSSTILTAPTSIDLMQAKLDELVKNFNGQLILTKNLLVQNGLDKETYRMKKFSKMSQKVNSVFGSSIINNQSVSLRNEDVPVNLDGNRRYASINLI